MLLTSKSALDISCKLEHLHRYIWSCAAEQIGHSPVPFFNFKNISHGMKSEAVNPQIV